MSHFLFKFADFIIVCDCVTKANLINKFEYTSAGSGILMHTRNS